MLFKQLWSSALALGLRIIPHRSDELVTLTVCVDVRSDLCQSGFLCAAQEQIVFIMLVFCAECTWRVCYVDGDQIYSI